MSELPSGLETVIARAEPLARRFADAGHRLYFVGGVVRDHLLSRTRDEQDLDATTDARPAEIKELVAALADAVWTQGERFGTIGCTIGGQTYEITTHRAEAYDPSSRKPTVSFGDRIEEDLARRDFTVNSMAVDLTDGELVDPFGGRADLAAGVLRTPLDPEISFSEDPLRMLRAARFHAGYHLRPEPGVLVAIESLLDRVSIVSAERVRDEFQKIILLDDPTDALVLMVETGLMAASLPVLGALDVDDAREIGGQLGAVPDDPAMRWTVVFGPASAKGLDRSELKRLKFSNQLTDDVLRLSSCLDAVAVARLSVSEASARSEVLRAAGSARSVDDRLGFVRALRLQAGAPVDDIDGLQAVIDDLRSRETDFDDPLPVLTGDEVCAVLGIEPGPVVGAALEELRNHRLVHGPLDREEAVERLRAWWQRRATEASD